MFCLQIGFIELCVFIGQWEAKCTACCSILWRSRDCRAAAVKWSSCKY